MLPMQPVSDRAWRGRLAGGARTLFSEPARRPPPRTAALAAAALLFSGAASATTVTLPAAASLVGGAPFYSDVRAFNTSDSEELAVTATYRCFIGNPCPAPAPVVEFILGPRESLALDDIVASAFHAPDTAGGVEFQHQGSDGQLVVTSRLYATAPTPTVGMFVPGLGSGQAYARTVLTSVRNLGPGGGFRTNAGVFNPGGSTVSATFRILDRTGGAVGAPVSRTVEAHSGAQVSGIFIAAGVPDFETGDAVVTVESTGPVFSYAVVIDNATSDPIFVVGAPDGPPGTPTITRTPTITLTPSITYTPSVTFTPSQTFTPSPTPVVTPTFTPTSTATVTLAPTITSTPRPTFTPSPNPNRIVFVGQNGTSSFVDSVSGTSNSTITVGTTIQWNWVSGYHSTTSGSCSSTLCTPDFLWDSANHDAPYQYTYTFNSVGTFSYYSTPDGPVMQGAVNVVPP